VKTAQTHGKLQDWNCLKVSVVALWEEVLCCRRPEMEEGSTMIRQGKRVRWR